MIKGGSISKCCVPVSEKVFFRVRLLKYLGSDFCSELAKIVCTASIDTQLEIDYGIECLEAGKEFFYLPIT
jgi:hypothetical protein